MIDRRGYKMEKNTEKELEESKRRHKEMTQLDVTWTLRKYQREWFAKLREEVFETGRPYIITGALTPHEIFEALDIPFITDVWYSGLVAARRQSAYYSDYLAKQGYHHGLSRYSSLSLAVAMDENNPDKPWGGLPKAVLVTTSNIDRSGQVLADYWGIPFIGIDVPASSRLYPSWWEMSRWNWEDLDETHRIDVMVAQFKTLIEASEKIAGKKLDVDRLREIVDRVNLQEEYFEDVRNIIRTAPKLPARLGEVMGQVMGIQWHRGTEWALNQARAFRDEIKKRAENSKWVCPNEKYRLMYIGAGLWQQLEFFARFEKSHGVVFARSNYLSIAIDGYLRYGTRDPIRALASRYVTFNRQMHIPPWSSAWALWEARTHRLHGGVQIARGTGLNLITRMLSDNGFPVLRLPVDPVDAGTWDDEKMERLVLDFIENEISP
ncbi:2-hydroxyacyl-CoA dehydratase [Thermodesulfobacteriota bacterium]